MYEPKRPNLAAAGVLVLWVAILSLPMLGGKWLANPLNDMWAAGYASRLWGATWWHRLGHVPLWEPLLFGGMPYIGAGHGDIFYATSFLRLLLPVDVVVEIGFVVHYILAGLFTYWFLRRLRVSWTGAVTGGLAYQLCGLLASYPSPGHDGKLYASAALPLACLGLVMALRERKPGGYAALTVSVAMALLGHFQIAYYVLIAAGLFALYLTFEENEEEPVAPRLRRLGLALGAVLLGFGIAAIQVLPFVAYIPFSPRAYGYSGFAGSVSYAIPWEHVPEFFLKGFVGARDTYWGSNPLKLHSEYLGLPVIALAALGLLARERRRLVYWLGGIGLLFLLISLGADTPFYRVFWEVMPMVKKTRAPGMAFFVVAFVGAAFAGLGAERLERREGKRAAVAWLVAAGAVILLAVSGAFGTVAANLAGPRAELAREDGGAIMWGAFTSGAALALVALLAMAALRERIAPRVFALALPLLVGADLWLNATRFWIYSPRPRDDWFRADPVTDRLRSTPLPYRILDLGAYIRVTMSDEDMLMAFDVPQVLGYHGNEIRYYDDLLGGKGEWANLGSEISRGSIRLRDLLSVRYILWPIGPRSPDSLPGYTRVLDSAETSMGRLTNVFERTDVQPYARVVPGAAVGDSASVIPTLMDPRLDYSRLVLFTPDQGVNPPPLTAMPPPSPSRATVTSWVPGGMTIALDPPPPAPSYVLVSENWFPDWRAAVDGAPARALRGDYALLTVPVPAGARQVKLDFHSPAYQRGEAISIASLALLVVLAVAPTMIRRRRRA